ncbi:hypothetical protein DM02DRAFT_634892 [Periconia macrospinosa]|uniref:Uncharacterized protein n=1 Tax=Periconia macrospinosa TaxID=97972 RepID=A0A2V1D4P3_9PLEO|nr:hypothetical protein DM02DRAFT_634892 [Periconia macrospinosa]
MSSDSMFRPGTIWWLPRLNDISDQEPLDSYCTVPPKCFSHSVLVVGGDETTQCSAIVILTSFGGGESIRHRIRNRGHEPQDYVPIHPAYSLYKNTPTLKLCASKEFKRLIWVNVQPYWCPRVWLQETWRSIWKNKDVGRSIETSSLCELARYAIRNRYYSVVYEQLLEISTPPIFPPFPLQNREPLRVDIPVDTTLCIPDTSAEFEIRYTIGNNRTKVAYIV